MPIVWEHEYPECTGCNGGVTDDGELCTLCDGAGRWYDAVAAELGAAHREVRVTYSVSVGRCDTCGGPKWAVTVVDGGEVAECPWCDHPQLGARLAPAVWDDSVPPGGYVCGAPDEGPDGICGMPVESEPCPYHGQPATGTPGDAAGPSGGVS